MNILIELRESEVRVFLRKEKINIDEAILAGNLNLSELLLKEIDSLLVKNNLKPSDIDKVDIKTTISDNLTTVRIAEMVAKTFNFYKNVD